MGGSFEVVHAWGNNGKRLCVLCLVLCKPTRGMVRGPNGQGQGLGSTHVGWQTAQNGEDRDEKDDYCGGRRGTGRTEEAFQAGGVFA